MVFPRLLRHLGFAWKGLVTPIGIGYAIVGTTFSSDLNQQHHPKRSTSLRESTQILALYLPRPLRLGIHYHRAAHRLDQRTLAPACWCDQTHTRKDSYSRGFRKLFGRCWRVNSNSFDKEVNILSFNSRALGVMRLEILPKMSADLIQSGS